MAIVAAPAEKWSRAVAGTKRKRSVIVGESWPDGVEIVSTKVHSPWQEPKVVIIAGIASLMGLLLLAFTAYAMIMHDQDMLSNIFSTVDCVVFIVLGWAGGKIVATGHQPGP